MLIVEKRHKELLIDTGAKDPAMVVEWLQKKLNRMYEVTVEGEHVLIRPIPCIAK